VASLGQGVFPVPCRDAAGTPAAVGAGGRTPGEVGALGAPLGFDAGAPEAGIDGFCTGALGAPVAGAPDAGMDGACAHAAEADSWAPKMSNVAIVVRRVVRLAMRVIDVLHSSLLDGRRPHGHPVSSGTG
jgi:hypothetical protein